MSPVKEINFEKQSPATSKRKRTKKMSSETVTKYLIENDKIIKDENNNNSNELNEAASKFKIIALVRASTPNSFNICEHCDHDHAQVS
jgi:hypothetical protein